MTRTHRQQIKILVCLMFTILLSHTSFAELHAHYNRPQIETVGSRPLPAEIMPARWQQNREGMLRFLAEMMAFYPTENLYFMARDGEYLYDMARILFRGEQQILDRFHLLNVSRVSMESDLLNEYLIQEGFTRDQLTARRAVLIDTCCEGTIDTEIRESLPRWAEGRVVSHFFESSNSGIPSSRVYLETHSPTRDISTITVTENIPHYTNSSIDYALRNGRYVPIADDEAAAHTQAYAEAIMEDIRHFSEAPETLERFQILRQHMETVVHAAHGLVPLDINAVNRSLRYLEEHGIHGLLQDIRDAAECENSTFSRKALAQFWRVVPGGKPKIHRTQITSEPHGPFPTHLAPYFAPGGPALLLKLTAAQRPLLLEILPHLSFDAAKRLLSRKHWSHDIDVLLHLIRRSTDLVDGELLSPLLSDPFWSTHPRSREILRLLSGAELDFGNELRPYFVELYRQVASDPNWQRHPDIQAARRSIPAKKLLSGNAVGMTDMHRYFQLQIAEIVRQNRGGSLGSVNATGPATQGQITSEDCMVNSLGRQRAVRD